jgi:Domain of unknown function (DUF4268)
MTTDIGKLTRVELREVWKHEARGFSQWLQNNIEVLNEALDLKLVNVDREQHAGDFSIDLVAEDESGGTVVIENQLGKSDHDHLGKLITYATALDAKVAIWIVSQPRPEHVAAVTWLNEAGSVAFYMVKVGAVKIDKSPAAPLFTLIVGPSEEGEEVGHTKKEIVERYGIRRRWWTMLLKRAAAKTKLHAHISPTESSWISAASGCPGLYYNYAVLKQACRIELAIDRGKGSDKENKHLFDQLAAHRKAIEIAFGAPLSWEQAEGMRACYIRYTGDFGGWRSSEDQWPQIQDSIIDAMIRFAAALQPLIDKLKEAV